MKKLFLFLAFIVGFFLISTAQKQSYSIKIKLNNYHDSILYLANYFGNSNQLQDTAKLNKNGEFVFSKKKNLDGGIYLVVTKEKRYFELLIDKEQNFQLTTDNNDFVKNMKINGSKENEDFYVYMNKLNELQEGRMNLEDEYKLVKDSLPLRKAELEKQFTEMNERVIAYKLEVAKTHPGTLLAAIINASKEPETPKVLPLNEKGLPDSTYIYKYYKQHYFDDFDFADARVLRSPIYASKLKKYFTQVLIQHPDTLIKEADEMIAKAKNNKETYKFCIWYFTYESEISNIMGLDAVFVHLVEKYYNTGEAYWATESLLENMKKRAATLKKLLIGADAPDMIMIDTNNNLVSMRSIPANYTLIIFWDPDCGHCKTEIPLVRDWNNENGEKYGIKIFAVCSDTNLVKWRKYITDAKMNWINVNGTRSATEDYHNLYDIISTPIIYVLDNKKRIIAKKIGHEQLDDFIKRDFEKNFKK